MSFHPMNISIMYLKEEYVARSESRFVVWGSLAEQELAINWCLIWTLIVCK